MTEPVPSDDDEAPEIDGDLAALFADLLRHARSRTNGQRVTLRRFVELAEGWRITASLREHRGNRSAAARALGIGRRTLYTKMEKLGIRPSWSAAVPGDTER